MLPAHMRARMIGRPVLPPHLPPPNVRAQHLAFSGLLLTNLWPILFSEKLSSWSQTGWLFTLAGPQQRLPQVDVHQVGDRF